MPPLPHPFRFGALLALLTALPAIAQIPAFPGAEGFGAHATGGRGGDVYVVTNLNASGAGSLREGIETAPGSGRTIVFAVSGYIHVPGSNLRIVQDNVTIAGQTAPGDGIGLKDGTVRITGDNCVIRNLRIRHGKYGGGGDCLNVDSSAHDSIIDHVSMQFSTDENISFFNSTLDNFSMQYSLSAWGLESHNAGGLWDMEDGSCHHSLWAHHHTRNPKARPYGVLEWVNNVTFDWGKGFIMGDSQTPAPWKANAIGCYFLSPPGNTDSRAFDDPTVDRNGNPNFTLYLDDCLHDSDGDGLLNGTDKGYSIVEGSEFTPGDPPGATRYAISATPFAGAAGNVAITVDDPLTAYKKVLSSAGAVRMDANYAGPLRDEVDTVLFNNVVNQIHSRISNENQLPVTNSGFGTLNSTPPPIDTDLDGMPDFWEQALGWNPASQDHGTVFGSTVGTFFPSGTPVGYTYLEEYLHFKSIPHATMAKNTMAVASSFTVDLRKFTSGFSDTPQFTISGVSNGTFQQFASNGTTPSATGPIVEFTPTVDFSGRAGFDFNVTDAAGSSWTQQFGILVTIVALPRNLIWTAQTNGTWDTATTNWETDGSTPTTFNDGDDTLFDDQGSTSSVSLSGSRTANAVTITGSHDYTFSGDPLVVATSLTKASDTTLTLNTAVTPSTGTYLNGGTTIINDGANIGGGPIRFTGGSTLDDNTGSNYLTLTPDIEVDAGAVGNIDLSSRININGSFSGGGTFNIFSPSTLGTEGRNYLRGTSAGCTGFVNISGGATAPGNGGRIVFSDNPGDFNGFPNARVSLNGIDLFNGNNSGGNPYGIGALSGDANSRLRGAYLGGITTWQIGALNDDTEFAGEIMDGLTGITSVEKYGTGTLTLSGNNSYTGGTAIHGGELRVTGSLGSTDNYVGGGTKLSGSGQVADLLTIQPGGVVAPGDAPGETGTMTATGGLTINSGGNLEFDLSSSIAGSNDEIIVSSGNLSLTSPVNVNVTPRDGALQGGNYRLVNGSGSTTQVGAGITMVLSGLPTNTRQGFGLNRQANGGSPAFIDLVVSGNASDLTWTGSTSTWDLANTTPWSGGAGGDNKFYNLDRVHFGDGVVNNVVTVTGTIEPQLVDVSADTVNYIFGGSGSIAGSARLEKSGAAFLVLNGTSPNTFSGGTLVSEGMLFLADNATSLGTGLVELAGGTLQLPTDAIFLDNSILVTGDCAINSLYGGNSTIVDSFAETLASTGSPTVDLSGVDGILSIKGAMDGFSGTLDFGSGDGMLRLNSGTVAAQDVNFGSATAHFALGTGNATLNNRNGDKLIDLGALSGGSGTHLNGRQSGSGNTSTTYRIGALGLSTSFDGTIDNAGDNSGVHLIKVGAGSLSLGGTSDYPGSIMVEAGTLAIPGSLTVTGTTEVDPGATLDLAGGELTCESVQIAPGATLFGPGTITGELVNDGTLECPGGTLVIDGPAVNNGIARLTSGSLLSVSGEFINNGILDLLTAGGEVPAGLVNNGTVIDSSDLELTSFGISGSDFNVTIKTHVGHNYQFQWSPDMSPGSWIDIGSPVAGDGTEKPFTHPNVVTNVPRYYHVVVTP